MITRIIHALSLFPGKMPRSKKQVAKRTFVFYNRGMTLTDRQKEVLDFIREYLAQEGFGPTVREICQALNLASPGSLMKHLRKLEKDGYLTKKPGKKRTWQPTGRMAFGPVIPVVGAIAAGEPILAQEHIETELPVDPSLFGCDTAFALKVKGDSMIMAHIQDGDMAIIRPQEMVDDGQVAAVLIDGLEPEATLKVFRQRGPRIELHAANPQYSPIIFEGSARSRVKILGRLVGVIRGA